MQKVIFLLFFGGGEGGGGGGDGCEKWNELLSAEDAKTWKETEQKRTY